MQYETTQAQFTIGAATVGAWTPTMLDGIQHIVAMIIKQKYKLQI